MVPSLRDKSSHLKRWLAALVLLMLLALSGCTEGISPPAPRTTPTAPASVAPGEPLTVTPTSPPPTPTVAVWPTATAAPQAAWQEAAQYFEIGDWQKAEAAYSDLIATASSAAVAAEAHYRLGQVYFAAGHWQQAADQFQQTSQSPNLPAERYFWWGRALTLAGDDAAAINAYQAYFKLSTSLADEAAKRIARNYTSLGEIGKAALWITQAIELAPTLAERLALREELANLWLKHGLPQAAVAEYDAILSSAQKPAYRAEILRQRGDARLASGDLPGAEVDWRRVLQEAPHTQDAYLALVQLVKHNLSVDEFLRAKIDAENKAWPQAQTALWRYLSQELTPEQRTKALCLLGRVATAQGDAVTGRQVWSQVHRSAACGGEAELALARLDWAAGDRSEAISRLQQEAKDTNFTAWAGAMHQQLAIWAEAQGKMDVAAVEYINAEKTFPDDRRYQAGLLAAVMAWTSRRPSPVLPVLSVLLNDPNLPEVWKPPLRFWVGQLQWLAGKQETAKETWRRLQSEAPDSYYAWQLTQTAGFPPPWTCSEASPTEEKTELINWLRRWSPALQPADLSGLPSTLTGSSTWQRAASFQRAGLYSQANTAFQKIIRETDDPVLLFRLAIYFAAEHLFHLSIAAANHQAAHFAPLPCAVQQLRFPVPWLAMFLATSDRQNVSPALLYAVAHQESHFNPLARSAAGAAGIMQLMPTTAKWLAGRMNWSDFTPRMLYQPQKNVEMGAYFLHWLADYLPEDLYAQLAGYNGGPGNARRWRRQFGLNDDIFLERLPALESRHYLRQVVRNIAVYRALYSRKSFGK